MKTEPPPEPLATNSPIDCDEFSGNRQRMRSRVALRLIFAIVLVLIASFASAEDLCRTIQYDGVHAAGHVPQPATVIDPARVGGADPAAWRPAYVDMNAYLANFDADAEPDGWAAAVVLRDRSDRPTAMRARATFELTPRIPNPLAGRFIEPGVVPIRWSMPLVYDVDGVARFKLPLRESQRLILGWQTAESPFSATRRRQDIDYSRTDISYNNSRRRRSFATVPVRKVIGTPNVGHLKVRVSVPTQGVFETVVLVQIRPAVLVDTPWPYR